MNVLGIESSCDETGVALVSTDGAAVPRLRAHAGFITGRFDAEDIHWRGSLTTCTVEGRHGDC
jgi:hypothetical protein